MTLIIVSYDGFKEMDEDKLSDAEFVLTHLNELRMFAQIATHVSMHLDLRAEFSIHSPITIQMANIATEEIIRKGCPHLDMLEMREDAEAYMIFFMGIFRVEEYYKSHSYPIKYYQNFVNNLLAYMDGNEAHYYYFTKFIKNMVAKCDKKTTWLCVGAQNWELFINRFFAVLNDFDYIDKIIEAYNYFESISFHPGLKWQDPFFIFSQTVNFMEKSISARRSHHEKTMHVLGR